MPAPCDPPTFADVEAAARRLDGVAVKTPLLGFPELDRRTGARVLVKPETLQRTGSFKFRGAYAKLSALDPAQRQRGVVAFSSGNHAQGVAAAAQLLGVPATIVMPHDAPEMKRANTRGYGAEVRLYDRHTEDRTALADAIVAETGATLVHPYDDREVTSGQGTCGLEIAQQAAGAGARLDAALFCCGGGGLSAGAAIAFAQLSPATQIYTVEPEGFDDTARSLAAGTRVGNAAGARSICDALLSPRPGELTFPILRRHGVQGLAVSDDEVRTAMAFAYTWLKLVVEPGGAVTLAALLSGKLDLRGRTVALVLSGGNVDAERFHGYVAAAAHG
ncbi:pyridoxal-5'-phosphate-dependent protein [Rhodovibrio sodomensis]|uniref:Pyridoxal-5'-phosphate-dependent protein n=1 Tax=Rhodovibrio sodomensis TaxID=1088 RepID=A0ABS1DBT1_9PROT|nr:threonine/serine dehydratase [Rhodovibrio sodomensis]MBK1667178.1 pyridoxal-5'-phosphate-dependent protein [Rhodovibrio sodomensis]